MLSLEKHSVSDIAQLLQVHKWIQNWNEHGKEGLLNGYGITPELNQDQIIPVNNLIRIFVS